LGFEVLYYRRYEGMIYANMRERRPLLGALLAFAVSFGNVLTLGRRDLREGDYHIVLRKRQKATLGSRENGPQSEVAAV
jgi:hypothetical protein